MSDSDAVPPLRGRPPETKTPRVEDFDELDKKAVETTIDYLKYVATASGIVMGFYGQGLRDAAKMPLDDFGKLLVFAPILAWMMAIAFSVIGVFPRSYIAKTDYEKELAVNQLRATKSYYSKLALVFFALGFLLFVYQTAAQIWLFYPFSR